MIDVVILAFQSYMLLMLDNGVQSMLLSFRDIQVFLFVKTPLTY